MAFIGCSRSACRISFLCVPLRVEDRTCFIDLLNRISPGLHARITSYNVCYTKLLRHGDADRQHRPADEQVGELVKELMLSPGTRCFGEDATYVPPGTCCSTLAGRPVRGFAGLQRPNVNCYQHEPIDACQQQFWQRRVHRELVISEATPAGVRVARYSTRPSSRAHPGTPSPSASRSSPTWTNQRRRNNFV